MFSFSKAKREIERLFKQILNVPSAALEYFFATPYYDFALSKQKKLTTNYPPTGKKFAVYLMFPSRGLLQSHLLALAYLKANGFEAVVVTNYPLNSPDREHLLENCWSLIERPNYGYDFGGYRDAMFMLAPLFHQMDRLVILNDSTWFPLPEKSDWLRDVEKLNVDFCGAISGSRMSRGQGKDHRNLKWTFSSTNRDFHYCSFALAFSGRLINDPKFLRFWRKIRLTKIKNKTVRRGEIGLSQVFTRSGFTHASTFDVAGMETALSKLPVERIAEITKRVILPTGMAQKMIKQDVLDRISMTEQWRLEAIKYILSCAALYGASFSTADFNITENCFGFLKKTPVAAGGESADISLEILSRLRGDGTDVFREEALNLKNRTKSTAMID
jgi:Rhamnan synthesis protein F